MATRQELLKEALNRGLINKESLVAEAKKRGLDVPSEEPVEAPPLVSREGLVESAKGLALGGAVGAGAARRQVTPELQQAVESRIGARELVPAPPKERLGGTLAGVVGAPGMAQQIGQRGEAAFANVALAKQAGRSVLQDFVAGLKGERLGRAADTLEKAGVPKIQSEIGGLAIDIAAGKGVEKLGSKIAKPIVAFGNNLVGTGVRLGGRKGQVKLANSIRQTFFGSKRAAGEAFEEGLDAISLKNPARRGNAEFAMSEFIKDLEANPAAKAMANSVKKKSKVLNRLLDNPEMAQDLTIKEMQDLKSDIRNVPALRGKIGRGKFGNYTENDIPFIDLLDDVKKAQLDAFPEMADINKAYGEVLNRYKRVKHRFKEDHLISNIKKNFGGDPETLDAVERMLNPKVMQRIGGFRVIETLLKAAGIIGTGEVIRRVVAR